MLCERLSRFFSRNIIGQKGVAEYIQSADGEKLPTKNSLPGKVSTQNEGKTESFPDKQRREDFITTNLALQEMEKGLF